MAFINSLTEGGITWPEAFVLVGLMCFAGFLILLAVAVIAFIFGE